VNVWDVVTWIAAALLAGSAITIFAFFLKDARKIFQGERKDRSDGE
jgi:hypothetical protein